MKLTNRSEYALLALIYLGRNAKKGFAHADQIASAQDIPKRFLQQILFTLKGARIVISEKGKNGGYGLARPAKEISLAEVIRLFEGALAPTRSASENFYQPTPVSGEKKLLNLFKEIRSMVANRLEKTSLAEML